MPRNKGSFVTCRVLKCLAFRLKNRISMYNVCFTNCKQIATAVMPYIAITRIFFLTLALTQTYKNVS